MGEPVPVPNQVSGVSPQLVLYGAEINYYLLIFEVAYNLSQL